MKHLANILPFAKSWPLATALCVVSLSSSRADDDFDTILLDATPAAAAAPAPAAAAAPAPVAADAPAPTVAQKAEAKPANKDAKSKEISKLVRLTVPIAYPTIYPNPLAFNMLWVTVSDKTFARVRALANRQQQKLRRVQVVVQAQQNPGAQNGIQQQLRKFLEPMLTVELSFAARVTDLNPAERRKLSADGKVWFDKFLVDYLKKMDPNQQQMVLQGMQGVWFGNNQQPTTQSPREALREGVAKLVKDTFPKDKAATYADECKKRDEFARQVSVDNLVDRIDGKVKLSPDQWKKVTKALNEHSDKKREPQLEGLALNPSMWPGAPEEWVLPELSPAQQAVLTRLDASSSQMFFGGGVFGQMFGGNVQVIDDDSIEINAEVVQPAAAAATPEAE